MDRKTIIYVVLLGILLIAYFPIMKQLGVISDPPPPAVDSTEVVTQQPAETNLASEPISQPVQTDGSQMAVTDNMDQPIDSTAAINVTADTIYISTNKYDAVLTSYGGGLVSLKLKDYFYRDGSEIEMIPNATSATPNIEFAGGTFETSNLNFTSSLIPSSYDVTSSERTLTYSYTTPSGSVINKKFTFYPDEHHIGFDIEVISPEKSGLSGRYGIVWNNPLGVTEPQPKIDYEAMEAAAMLGKSREKLNDFDDGRLKQSMDGYVDWAGVRNKYFAAVFIPTTREGESVFSRGSEEPVELDDGSMVDKREITVGINFPFVSSFSDNFKIFVGPLDYQELGSYDVGLEDILDIGTTPVVGILIKIFAIPIMYILPIMYDFIPNYGVVIILFALLVKIITLPLSMKSFKSMNAMKELQPRLEELKKKHKKNPQALNSEMMKLYKEHGVNPISGCLPMLPQMPLFFAMFSVFRSTILLRDAPFVWFIDDLSRGASSFTDPYIILVVIMVVGQFVSQKLTMASNQQNQMLMYLMPLFMGWIFHTFAAGLVLYWACFSILSLLDYFLFKRKAMKNTHVQTT